MGREGRRMGRPPGRTGDETRARILSAARECFGRFGYAGTSVQTVADPLGLTAAALYRYFDSKLALYVATVEDAFDALVPRYEEAVAGAPTTGAALAALAEASADLHGADPSLAAFLSALLSEMRRDEALARAVVEKQEPLIALVTGVVERGRARGDLPEDVDDGAVVAMFLACSSGLSQWADYFGAEGSTAIHAFARLLDGRLWR